MPALLSEMGSLSILTPQPYSIGTDRFHNAPPIQPVYKDYTMIEDIATCQTALPPGTSGGYSMPEYNSNAIIPGYNAAVCPSNLQQTYLNLSRPGMLPYDQYLVPNQQRSFQHYVNKYNAQYPQYNTAFEYPPFAGAVPSMRNARATDQTLPMNDGVLPPLFNPSYAPPPLTPIPQEAPQAAAEESKKEGFHFQDVDCSQCLAHLDKCKICKQYLGYSTQNYKWFIVILLLIIVGLIVYIVMNKKHSRQLLQSIQSGGSSVAAKLM